MKLRFRLQNEEVSRHSTPGGCGDRPTFTRKIDEVTGGSSLVETGKRDQYSLIQSFAAVTDLSAMLDRFARGDVSALSRVRGIFGDFTGFGSDPQSQHLLINRANEVYADLPNDLKSKYPTFMDFLSSFGSADAFSRFEADLSAFHARSTPTPIPIPTTTENPQEVS